MRDGSNWFTYVNNNPVNWVDPIGLLPIVMWDQLDGGGGSNTSHYGLDIAPTVPGTTGSLPDGSLKQNAQGEKANAGVNFGNPLTTMNITSPFGTRTDAKPKQHDGIDLSAPKGTPVYAAEKGTVVNVYLQAPKNISGGEHSFLKIEHANAWETRYLHLDSFTVKAGDAVAKGQLIGYTGDKQNVAPHLHFEIRKDNVKKNPMDFLSNSKTK